MGGFGSLKLFFSAGHRLQQPCHDISGCAKTSSRAAPLQAQAQDHANHHQGPDPGPHVRVWSSSEGFLGSGGCHCTIPKSLGSRDWQYALPTPGDPAPLHPWCHFHHTSPSCFSPKQESRVPTASPALPALPWAGLVAEWAAQAAQGTQGALGVSVPLSSLPVLPSIPQQKPQSSLIVGEKEYERIKKSAQAPTEREHWDRLKTLKARQDAAFVGISFPAPSSPAPRPGSREGGFTKGVPFVSHVLGHREGCRAWGSTESWAASLELCPALPAFQGHRVSAQRCGKGCLWLCQGPRSPSCPLSVPGMQHLKCDPCEPSDWAALSVPAGNPEKGPDGGAEKGRTGGQEEPSE